MRKHKLFLPIILTLTIFILGTSLAFGIIDNGKDTDLNAGPAGSNNLEDFDPAGVNEQEPEQQMSAEETQDQEDQATITEEAASIEEETDKAQEDKNVKEDETVEEEPTESPAPQPVKNKMARVTVNGLNVRPEPSVNNQPIDVLNQGQTAEVLAEQNNWFQVKLPDGRIGWISGAYASIYSPSADSGGALAGRVIVIDPGHGGSDPGAVGVTGLQEKEVNLDVALRAAAKLRAQGAQVIMTRKTDVFIPLTQRVSIAESAGAEVFVSVHANAHPSAQIGGTETYYYGSKAASNASYNLAAYMQSELAGALRLRDIGVKDASFLVIRQTSMPSVLLELGFLSNAHEESLMRTDEFRQKAADAIVRALQNYFK